MRTIQQIYDLLSHAVGYSVASGHDLIEDINSAGEAVFSAHRWGWAKTDPVVLVSIAGNPWIDLPDDFDAPGEFVKEGYCIRQVLADAVESLHKSTAAASREIFMSIEGHTQSPAATGVPRRRAHLWPTPDSSGAYMTVMYRRRWRRVTADDMNIRPNVPPELEWALVCKARAIACQIENQAFSVDEQAFDKEIERVWLQDSSRTINVGRMTGGADRFNADWRFAARGTQPVEITRNS